MTIVKNLNIGIKITFRNLKITKWWWKLKGSMTYN